MTDGKPVNDTAMEQFEKVLACLIRAIEDLTAQIRISNERKGDGR